MLQRSRGEPRHQHDQLVRGLRGRLGRQSLLCSLALMLACSAAAEVPDVSSEAGTRNGDAGGGAVGAVGAAGAAGATSQSGPDWCAARAILRAKCQRCHSEPQENGAPFALLTYADTQAEDRAGTPRFEKMKAALESDYMPPQFLKLTPEVEPLLADERSTLLTWLAGEPPLDSVDCD
jgi:uncharacterized membrane protein